MATLNERTVSRINFHATRAERRSATLEQLDPTSKAYARRVKAIQFDSDMVSKLQSQLQARLDAGKGSGPAYTPSTHRGPHKGVQFDIVVGNDEPLNDVEFVVTTKKPREAGVCVSLDLGDDLTVAV